MKRIACIGEVMIELVNNQAGHSSIGVAGDTYNTAVYLGRDLKEAGIVPTYVTALGVDRYSAKIVDALQEHNLDVSQLERRDDKMPGLYAIDTDDEGERSFSYWRSDSAARTLFQEPCTVTLGSLDSFDLIYLSGITMAILHPTVRDQLITYIKAFRAAGGTFAYDSNYRPKLWESQAVAQDINTQLWQLADIALPSIDDEMDLFEDADEAAVLARFSGYGVPGGALKRGKSGPLDLANHQTATGLNVVEKVVDSTAAGDSFNAGFLAAFVKGDDVVAAMRAGHNLAARVISERGAIIAE
ncbi:MAG: sugar kinase [Thalassovita sp.]